MQWSLRLETGIEIMQWSLRLNPNCNMQCSLWL